MTETFHYNRSAFMKNVDQCFILFTSDLTIFPKSYSTNKFIKMSTTCEQTSDNLHATMTYFKQRVCSAAGGPFYKKSDLSTSRPVGLLALEFLEVLVSDRSVDVA